MRGSVGLSCSFHHTDLTYGHLRSGLKLVAGNAGHRWFCLVPADIFTLDDEDEDDDAAGWLGFCFCFWFLWPPWFVYFPPFTYNVDVLHFIGRPF